MTASFGPEESEQVVDHALVLVDEMPQRQHEQAEPDGADGAERQRPTSPGAARTARDPARGARRAAPAVPPDEDAVGEELAREPEREREGAGLVDLVAH